MPFYIVFIRKTDIRSDVLLSNITTKEVPIWEKTNLTVEETSAYSGIGLNKIRELTKDENCPFVLRIGAKRLIKRKLFDAFIERQYSI